jgi:hypothetical protein
VSALSRPWLRHTAHGVVFVALLVLAGFVTQTTPTNDEWQSPIPVPAEIGETATGRNIEATVTDVRVARAVTTSNGWAGLTSGIWVVVDASVAAVVQDGVPLGTAQLQIGSVAYSATLRAAPTTLADATLSTGIPLAGSLLFEIPEDVLTSAEAADTDIHLAINGDPRSDSMIVVPVDLSSIAVEDAIDLDAPEWGQQ